MRRWTAVAVFFAVTLLTADTACDGCSFYSGRVQQEPAKSAQSSKTSAAPRDLSRDEAAGGHTLARHVGRSDDELRDRLMHERISAASTYSDAVTAEKTVGAAIAASDHRVRNWAAASGGHPNLVLDYDAPQSIGRTLNRRDPNSRPCSHAIVVLKWVPPADYYVLTSYPECK